MKVLSNKKYLCLFLLFCFLFSSGKLLQAQPVNAVSISVAPGGTYSPVSVKDDWFGNSSWNSIESIQLVQNIVLFEINEDALNTPSEACTYEAHISVKRWAAGTDPNNIQDATDTMLTLQITHDPNPAKVASHRAFTLFHGAHKLQVTVNQVLKIGSCSGGTVPAMRVRAEIKVKRKAIFDCNQRLSFQYLPPVNVDLYDFYLIDWNGTTAAEEYDLEWVFYDLESQIGQQVLNGTGGTYTDFDFLFQYNATRITVGQTDHKLSLLYPEGYVFFRVRPARIHPDGWREFGAWSSVKSSPVNLRTFSDKIKVAWHQNNLNWQANTVFAEEGKNIPSISFYDGSLRARQQVTLSNAIDKRIVGQTLYDHHGRPAVNIIPTPTDANDLRYSPSFANKQNGNKFTKEDFDLGDCSVSAVPLDTTQGAGRYFSTLNSNASNDFHQFIPHAEGFPYSTTEYTPDLTGRIRKQGGVGKEFQIKAGSNQRHTRYLYGKPTQEEIDRLFGNDAGDNSHYLKNAVIDANGQASVSYVDAHGRTVATALAGTKPSNVEQIDSGFSTASNLTSSLLNNERDGNSLVSTHKLIVLAPGNQAFQYSIPAQEFRKDCLPANVCYDCLYDLEIRISDNDCNEFNSGTPYVATKENYQFSQELDTLCGGSLSGGMIDSSFILTLPVGEYTITKILSVSESSLDYYTEHFMTQSTCLPKLEDIIQNFVDQIDTLGCGMTCEECVSSMGGEATFIANLQMEFLEVEETISYEDAREIYRQRVAACKELCENPSHCDIIWQSMLNDFSPGGQYATFKLHSSGKLLIHKDDLSIFKTDGIYSYQDNSVLYTDEAGGLDSVQNGQGQLVPPNQLSSAEFYKNWKDSWAVNLVEKYHPEYCLYQAECLNKGLDTLDFCRDLEDILTWQQAVDSGYVDSTGIIFDPYFQPGAPGYDCIALRDSMLDSLLVSTSLTKFVVQQTYGDNDCHCYLGGGTTAQNDQAWEMYKTLYCSMVQQIIQQKQDTSLCGNNSVIYCIQNPLVKFCGTLGSNPYASKKRRFVELDLTDYTTEEILYIADSIRMDMVDSCFQNCEDNVDTWLMQLDGCGPDGLSNGQRQELKDRLIAVCQMGCDKDHPFGASTTPAGQTTSYGDSSFEQIVNHFFSQAGLCNLDCSHLSINSISPYEAPAYQGGQIRSSISNTCICEKLDEYQNCYNDSIPSGTYVSFAQYLSQFAETRLTDNQIDTLLRYCSENIMTTLPEYMTIPAYLECDVCKDCEEMTALKNHFDTNICTPDPNQPILYEDRLTRYLNHELGFARDWYDYQSFFDSCNMAVECISALVLCPRGGELVDSADINQCYNSLRMQAEVNAYIAWEELIDSIRQDFRTSYISHCLGDNSMEVFEADLTLHEYHYTLYYYDQAGNLVQTVPPNGVTPITSNSMLADVKAHRANPSSNPIYPSHSFFTKYLYNSLGQVVKQISPDTEETDFWYDPIGRLVLSQDGRQRPQNFYSYTLYDDLGRIIEVGEKEFVGTISSSTIADPQSLEIWLRAGTLPVQVTRTFYDESAYQIDAFDNGQQNLRTRVASIIFENVYDGVDSTYDYASHYSYDASGNVNTLVQEISDLHSYGQGYKRLDYEYDYISGNVHAVYYQKGKADQFTHRYIYDANNRLTQVYSSLVETTEDGALWDREASYAYYDHGPLARSVCGHQGVQGMDYAYTLQGWIKGVNSSGLVPERDMGKDGSTSSGSNTYIARDAIGYTLGYFDKEYKAIGGQSFEMTADANSDLSSNANDLFNGNIRYMSIHNKGLGEPMAFSYSYDQLHRIKSMQSHANADLNTFSWGSGGSSTYGMAATYDGNGNIQALTRDGLIPGTQLSKQVNNLTYNYQSGTNKLIGTTDDPESCRENLYVDQPILESLELHASEHLYASSDVDSSQVVLLQADSCVELLPGFTFEAGDGGTLDVQLGPCPPSTPVNASYQYDGKGNIVKTTEADSLIWSPYGKVLEVRQANTNRKTLFGYDPAQNRAMKALVDPGTTDTTFTYYFRDASNNILAVYQRRSDSISWKEQYLYGSSRLGSLQPDVEWTALAPFQEIPYFVEQSALKVGWKQFSLTNHLGNVLATVSDRKIRIDSSGNGMVDFFEPFIVSASDYYPFGLEMPGRVMSAGKYRFGFNGKEIDRGGEWGGSEHYDYGFRIYNPSIAKFLSVDPLTKEYAALSPYQFAANSPIANIDLDGLEPYLAAARSGAFGEDVKVAVEGADDIFEAAVLEPAKAIFNLMGGAGSGFIYAFGTKLPQALGFDVEDDGPGRALSTKGLVDFGGVQHQQLMKETAHTIRDEAYGAALGGTAGAIAKPIVKGGKAFIKGRVAKTIDDITKTNPIAQTAEEFSVIKGKGLAIGADGLPQKTPEFIYRKARNNDSLIKDLTRRPGEEHLSASEALSSDLNLKGTGANVFNNKKGAPFIKIDVSKLPNGADDLILDGGTKGFPAGHISIRGSVTPEQIREAIIDFGKVPKVKK